MMIFELIEQLSKHDPKEKVFIGYEGICAEAVSLIKLAKEGKL